MLAIEIASAPTWPQPPSSPSDRFLPNNVVSLCLVITPLDWLSWSTMNQPGYLHKSEVTPTHLSKKSSPAATHKNFNSTGVPQGSVLGPLGTNHRSTDLKTRSPYPLGHLLYRIYTLIITETPGLCWRWCRSDSQLAVHRNHMRFTCLDYIRIIPIFTECTWLVRKLGCIPESWWSLLFRTVLSKVIPDSKEAKPS